MARTEPSTKVASFADRDTTEMGANAYGIVSSCQQYCPMRYVLTQHDKPFWFLNSLLVRLRIAQCLPFCVLSVLDLALSSVTDKDRLASPFDDDLEMIIRDILRH